MGTKGKAIEYKRAFVIEKWTKGKNDICSEPSYYVDTILRNDKLVRIYTKNRDNALKFDTYEQACYVYNAIGGSPIKNMGITSIPIEEVQ